MFVIKIDGTTINRIKVAGSSNGALQYTATMDAMIAPTMNKMVALKIYVADFLFSLAVL